MATIKLTKKQIKVIKPFVDNFHDAEVLAQTAATLIRKTHGVMWEAINKLIPELETFSDKTIEFSSFEISGIKGSDKLTYFKSQKEACIKEQDFEVAAKWRDKEKKERVRLEKKN